MSTDMPAALIVDLYELTMVDAYRQTGMADRPATFSLFVRSLPPERGYLVAAGLDDVLSWLERLRYEPDELEVVDRLGLFDGAFLEWLSGLRFTGSVRAVAEGTAVFAHEPILEVDAPLAEAQLAETFLLNQITLQTSLASKAVRCRQAAAGRAVVDFALRRSHGIDAGMKLARICALVGLSGTSNVAGADRYGVAASGTMAHAFVQAHENEVDAFRAFGRAFGAATVFVVDTYDTHRGIDRAVMVADEMRGAGVVPRGLRIDSGDLARHAEYARRQLDAANLEAMKIFVSGGLDEHKIHRLVAAEHAPIDGFGVGSALGVSADAPTLDSVYKLVAFDGRPVQKTSTGKQIWPGAKQVWRAPDWSEDVITLVDEPAPEGAYRPLLEQVMVGGKRVGAGSRSLSEANHHFEREWEGLPDRFRALKGFDPYAARISDRLQATARSMGPD
ncbi:MAG: nicotinate phosphoribosyltransferase [Actinomycetota bacterium]